MDSLKQKYKDVREEGIRNKVSNVRGEGLRKKVPNVFNRDKDTDSSPTHAPRPISELKDPSFYPPPPRRRTTDPHGAAIPSRPLPARTATSSSRESASSAPAPPPSRGPAPSLPPRLPPRQASSPAPHDPYINQAATSRLAASGISVPDLGISPSPSHQQQQPQQSGGSSWAQKRSALQTIGNFQRDPSSVSVSDARAAAGTANDFRERHGEQVARGARAAGDLGQRFGVAERLGANSGSNGGGGASSGAAAASSLVAGIAGKRKPPPPPPKKAALAGGSLAPDAPPPLPMGTKPRFS